MRKEIKACEKNKPLVLTEKAKQIKWFVWEPNFHFSPEMNLEGLKAVRITREFTGASTVKNRATVGNLSIYQNCERLSRRSSVIESSNLIMDKYFTGSRSLNIMLCFLSWKMKVN